MSYSEVFDEQKDFEISEIEESGIGFVPEEIKPEYESPSISMNTGGRFVKHEVIGGATVRQRVGDKPIEVSISGVCFQSTADDLILLRNAKYAKLLSDRFPNGNLKAHIVSVSTDPMSEGGAAPIHGEDGKEPELLYTYSIEAVEILDIGDAELEGLDNLSQVFSETAEAAGEEIDEILSNF
jgi:hypothetical protein